MASAVAGGRALLDLDNKQLRKLATAVHAQELESLQNFKFKSQQEQLQYLNSCKVSHKTIEELLDLVETMKSEIEQSMDETKKSIAHDVFEYANNGVSLSLQLIRSYDIRRTHLQKLHVHCESLVKRLRSLDRSATEIKTAQDLALEALTYRKAIIDHAKKMQHFIPNQFTKWLKESGLKLEELLEKYRVKLNLTKPFRDLSDAEKLQVYESIIEAAGRGSTVVTYSFEALGALGGSVLVFTAGAMVWDIFTAEDKVEAAVRDFSDLLLTQLDITALATAAIENGLAMTDIEVAGAAISVVGAVAGFGITALVGLAVGTLLDAIFSSGSTKVLSTQGLTHCYLSPMPDGIQLAHIVKASHP